MSNSIRQEQILFHSDGTHTHTHDGQTPFTDGRGGGGGTNVKEGQKGNLKFTGRQI